MESGFNSLTTAVTVKAEQNPLADRFKIDANDCDVEDKAKLTQYRLKWQQWMSWYGYGSPELHNIQAQIHQMLFNDLTYRAVVSVRSSVDPEASISARSPTLAYLLDQGYVVSQVLALQKLLDDRKDVVSVKRFLKDVERHRGLITREVYVAGDGLPYDYNSWPETVNKSDPMIQMYGIDAPGLGRFATSKLLHETFDLLSGTNLDIRTRTDVIPRSIFRKLDAWISGPSAKEIGSLRNNFVAHAADALRLGSTQFKGVSFSQIDELQREIVRVIHILIDDILSIRIGRPVVPMAPLGLFRGLNHPHSPSEAEAGMHQHWDQLSNERNGWTVGVLKELTSSQQSE